MRFAAISSLLTDAHTPAFIPPGATVSEAVRLLQSRQAPALLVQQASALGLVSNAQIIDGIVAPHRDPDATRVSELMIAVACLDGSASLERVWESMQDGCLRHVAICEGSRVIGIVSRIQIMQWMLSSQEEEVEYAMGAVKCFALASRSRH